MILYNGNFITMDKRNKFAQAVKIKGNKFVKVSTNEEILSMKFPGEECIDLEGKTVIPGLNDSHMHLYGFGLTLQMVNLMNVQSIDEIILKVKSYINDKNIAYNRWIQGRGWNQDYFTGDKRFPTRMDLDQISTKHPIILTRACGHMAVVNSKTLEVCGINHLTEEVEGGAFDIDLGLFRENALSLIFENMPKPRVDDIKETLLLAMKYANSKGLTSIQTDDLSHAGNYKQVLKAYEALRDEGKLTCRIYEQSLLNKEELIEFLSLGYNTGVGNEFFKIGPLKVLSDGSLGARTAALTKPYADDPSTRGIMCYSQEELDDLIGTAHQAGMQIAVHCIGDRAMYMVFESYEKILEKDYRANHRHGIIHCQIMDEYLLNKYKELDICAYVQPIFLHYDLHIVEDRVGKELAKTSYAFKSMIDKGIHTSFGTDCPVEALDTMSNIHCAVTRSDLSGEPIGGWNPKERLSVYEALYHYTQEGAYTSFEENTKGSITENKFADLVVLKDDILKTKRSNIKDIEVLMTFVGGKMVYKNC
ncbi:amidohydrolase [Mycoplasmatota bacterium]|nr:amidohydrolase [Mycoplasmatota bacterium]